MKRIAMRNIARLLMCALVAMPGALSAQSDSTPQPAPPKPTLQRIEATDPVSGNHYVRLLLSLPESSAANQAPPPRFTIQCEDINGKHEMLWFVSFGGVADPGYEPPFHSSATNLYPPRFPGVNLKMTFEGYIKSKPFTRSWSAMPSRELRYRNSGGDGPNMEPARWFMGYLNSLPGLRLAYAKREKEDPEEILFPTQLLLDALKKTPICSP